MLPNKAHLNIVVIGHVGSGKSTIAGHIIFKCGGISESQMKLLEKQSSEMNKVSSKYAWVLDKLKAERERGITIDISLCKFETPKYCFTVIDVPGHKDLIKNTITGTSQADAALFVIDGSDYKTGISETGSTREHALLAHALGIRQIIVLINKMDAIDYSQERFNTIKQAVSLVLSETNVISYERRTVTNSKDAFKYDEKPSIVDPTPFIPVCGFNGDNLVSKEDDKGVCNISWYEGKTVVQQLDDITPPLRPIELPLRVPLQDVYNIASIGVVAVGYVATGVLKPGMVVTFAPVAISSQVGAVEIHHQDVEQGNAGNIVAFHTSGLSANQLARGTVASDATRDPACAVQSFLAQVVVMNFRGEIRAGYTPIIDCHTAHVACRFADIRYKLDSTTNAYIKKNPTSLKTGDTGIVNITPLRPFCVEPYTEYPPLGRFVVRDMRHTVAVGVVKSCDRITGHDKEKNIDIITTFPTKSAEEKAAEEIAIEEEIAAYEQACAH